MTRLLIIAAISLLGFLSALVVLFTSSTAPAACAALGQIPSCEVRLCGYSAVFASTLVTGRSAIFTFLPGWFITLSLSVTGLLDGAFSERLSDPASLIDLGHFVASIALAAVWTRPFWRQIKRSRG